MQEGFWNCHHDQNKTKGRPIYSYSKCTWPDLISQSFRRLPRLNGALLEEHGPLVLCILPMLGTRWMQKDLMLSWRSRAQLPHARVNKKIQLRVEAQKRWQTIFKTAADSRQQEPLKKEMKNIRVNEYKSWWVLRKT